MVFSLDIPFYRTRSNMVGGNGFPTVQLESYRDIILNKIQVALSRWGIPWPLGLASYMLLDFSFFRWPFR